MSLYKNPHGVYEADIRVVDVDRVKLSMRTRKKTVAEPRYDALRRLARESKGPAGADRRALLEQVRTGALPIERLESMVANGEPLVPAVPLVADLTVAWPTVDVAIERYISWMQVNPTRRKSTWEQARAALRRFGAFEVDGARMGGLTLDLVTSAHAEAYQRSLIDAKAAPNTIRDYVMRIGFMWSWIQRRENRNAIETRRVAVVIHSPLDPEIISRQRTSRDRWLTTDEATALLTVTPDRLRFVVACGLFGGMRIGEVLTLRTHVDIDLELGTIAIQAKQVGVHADGTAIIWEPKTKRSKRVVPISSDLRPILEEHMARFASSDWMMPAIDDPTVPFDYGTFNNHFAVIVANAGLIAGRKDPRGVTFHTLRHTFASWLIMTGKVDLYTVAKLLGDTLQVVEQTYAHLAPDWKRRAVEALKGAITIPAPFEKTATETATTEALCA